MNGFGDTQMAVAKDSTLGIIRAQTLRERLTSERDRLQARLDEVSGLLDKLNANPAVADLVDEVFRVVR